MVTAGFVCEDDAVVNERDWVQDLLVAADGITRQCVCFLSKIMNIPNALLQFRLRLYGHAGSDSYAIMQGDFDELLQACKGSDSSGQWKYRKKPMWEDSPDLFLHRVFRLSDANEYACVFLLG